MTATTVRSNLVAIVGRFLGYTASTALMLLGFCILLAFSGPVYVEPHFESAAQMLKGIGLLTMFGGAMIMINLVFWGDLTPSNKRDIRVLNVLLAIILAIATIMAVIGAYGYLMA